MGPVPFLLLSLLGTGLLSNALPSLSSIKSINEFNNAVATILYRAKKLASTEPEPINTIELFINDTQLVVDYLNGDYPIPLSDSMQKVLDPLIDKIGDSWGFNETTLSLLNSFKRCDEFYQNFVDLTKTGSTEENTSDEYDVNDVPYEKRITNFVNAIRVADGNQLTNDINNIYELMTPGMLDNIFATLSDYLSKFDLVFEEENRCDFPIPVQDSIKNIYDLVVLNEIRGFAMNIFALNYEQIASEADNKELITDEISAFIDRMSRTIRASKTLLSSASSDLIRCDPNQHVLDETCFRLEDLFTEYYVNERQLSEKCDFNYKYFSSYNRIECLDETGNDNLLLKYYCPRRQCNGKLHDCRRVTQMAAFCESPSKSGPRYLWIVEDYNSSYVDLCPGQFVDTMTESSCNNLVCQCSEEGAESMAIRAVNMMPQMADTKNNMVVTNMRFLKQDNMVHLQIEQGLLLPEGKIDPDTVEIVPVGKFRYLKNTEAGSFVMVNPEDEDDEIYLKYDANYTFLRHDHNRFHLDEIDVGKNYVVTGVRLRNSEPNPENGFNTKPIELQVHATLFDYHQGLLRSDLPDASKWITSANLDNTEGYTNGRELLDLSTLGDSMNDEYINLVDSLPNQEIEFQPSSIRANLGQTTIPYFDARPAVETSSRALRGVGIIHRGTKDFGGFLAPKIMAVDHTRYTLAGVRLTDLEKYMHEWKN